MLASLDRASQGMAVLEAADQLALEREPNEQLYRMVVGALRTIADAVVAARRPGVLLEAARRRRAAPRARRLRPLRRGRLTTPLVAFDLDEGGALCRTCRSGVPVSAAALDLLRSILGGRLNDALATPDSPATHEVATLATKALEHHLERRLRAVAMFER